MRTILPILALLCTLTLGSCGGEPPQEVASQPLRVGTEAAYPPFESVADDGSLVGLDIDLVRALGEHLGRPIEFRNTAFDSLIPDLQAGRNDLICSGLSYTEDRAEAVDFTRPYVRVTMGVLVSTARAADVTTLTQLAEPSRRFVVQKGTSGAMKAAERFPLAAKQGRIAAYDREVDAANEVAAGRADAFVYDMVSVVKLHAQHAGTTRILDEDLGVEHYCLAVPKGSPLLAEVNAFLGTASAPGGVLDALLERWLPDPDRFRVRDE